MFLRAVDLCVRAYKHMHFNWQFTWQNQGIPEQTPFLFPLHGFAAPHLSHDPLPNQAAWSAF